MVLRNKESAVVHYRLLTGLIYLISLLLITLQCIIVCVVHVREIGELIDKSGQ